ncbi:DUF2510 domain-containing protein [Microbacterium sp. Ag1]|uniref:DUF2510 domain-containing protein n=1 Tax=Microbacterium sp. Ag1 TaxID=1643443 RepID=UPI0009E462B5|nr:DUF2510 domain-containing protein [Microbacterium sp. Ag1]
MTTPAGWYDDGSGNRRWWDGLSWTEHVVTGHPAAVTESEVTTSTAEDAHVAADPTAPAAATDPGVPTTAATGQPLGTVADLEPAPFAPPYTLAHQMPASPPGRCPRTVRSPLHTAGIRQPRGPRLPPRKPAPASLSWASSAWQPWSSASSARASP